MIHVGIKKMIEKRGLDILQVSKKGYGFFFKHSGALSVFTRYLIIIVLLIDIGLIRGLAGCVYVNSWNPLRAFVMQMWSVYAPRRDDMDNRPTFLFSEN